ncbi:cytochrome ubiquinol oxidase subunit I, partial [Mycobacterium sp.]
MNVVDVSRWQFGITTVYHFIFVPLTIGLAPLIAVMQTAWVVTDNVAWYRLTKFFGKLFLINFAIGVATGIVQEFQFGMNWSEYSRFVGDVFGAPLAMEGLAAFFFESTFIGLWIFGWNRLPRLVHLACIWIVAIAVNVSAFFIIVANSFMQHPVGAHYNPATRRAELHSITALLGNNTARAAFSHTVAGSLLTAATFVAAISAWWLVRSGKPATDHPVADADARTIFRPAAILGCWVALIATVGLFFTGDYQGKLMFVQQPMKMASAESLCNTETDPDFSILTVGTHNNCDSVTRVIEVPYVLPFLAQGRTHDVTLQGVRNIQQDYQYRFGPNDYRPNLFVTYWS